MAVRRTARSAGRRRSLDVACFGVGNIGRSWALAFALHGHRVRLYDPSADAAAGASRSIASALTALARARLVRNPATIRSRIEVVRDVRHALRGVHYVQESAPEDRTVKRAAIEEIAAFAPTAALIGSSSSTIPGSEFMQVKNPGRCMVVHPVNPPHVIRAVELVPTPWTTRQTIARISRLMTSIGQRPVLLRRELFGFVVNRLQFALVNEALHLIRDGVCDAEAIDVAMRDGLGPRWAMYGVFRTSHLNASGGIREYYSKFAGTLRAILECLHTTPCVPDAVLTQAIAASLEKAMPVRQVPAHQQSRDLNLMRLRRFLASHDDPASGD
jgi:L-gulonate 3-dehydrogenase